VIKVINIILSTLWVSSIMGSEATPFQELAFSSDCEDKFVDVVQYLVASSNECSIPDSRDPIQKMTLDVTVDQNHILVRAAKKQSSSRDYSVPVTADEKADLAYITSTLGRSSLAGIASSKSSLKKAGDRIDHLHPLRFLMTIFTDEELKADISAIRSRGWIWDKFFDGLEGSLKDESKRDNIRPEFIEDFANTVGINPGLIQPAIQEKRWKALVNILIDAIPRTGNPGRYNM
jgi:hypothetical protein